MGRPALLSSFCGRVLHPSHHLKLLPLQPVHLVRQYNINAQERICSLVNRAKVVVFMRGTERSPSPACSGSREVAAILAACRVHWDAVNVLTDHNAEEGIKEYTGDPRLPLVFLAGQLLGAVADLRAAYTSGQLELLLHQ